jgi:hypothetical protein
MNKPTREMIEKEPAGRRMDAWVELFVMSGELKTMWNIMTADGTGIYDGPFERESIAIDNLKKDTWLHDTGAKVGSFQVARNTYSTDIAAAFQILDKSDELGYPYVEMAYDSITWSIELIGESDDTIRTYSDLTSPSLCVAICRVLLLAALEKNKI